MVRSRVNQFRIRRDWALRGTILENVASDGSEMVHSPTGIPLGSLGINHTVAWNEGKATSSPIASAFMHIFDYLSSDVQFP
jgi:hypothetical protein